LTKQSLPQRENTARRSTALLVGLLILLLAAVLRLSGFEETPIGGDQTAILATAAEIASFRSFPLVGSKSSAGVTFTALPQYLVALSLLLVRRVIAVRWFLSLLDLLSIAWLYRSVRQTIGFHAAWISSLLYATNPWVVEFLRWIWQPTLVAASAVTTFASFLWLLGPTRRKQAAVLAVGLVSATLMWLLHLSALPWAAVCWALGFLIAWRKGLWRGFWTGVGVNFLLAFPYILFLIKTSFADSISLLQAGVAGEGGWNIAAYLLAFELITGAGVLATPRSPRWAESVVWIPSAPEVLLTILALAFIVTILRALRRPRERPLLLFVATWLLLTPTLFLRSKVHLQHFYLSFLFPAPFVLIGNAVQGYLTHSQEGVLGRLGRITGGLTAGLLLFLALWWASLWAIRIGLEERGVLGPLTRAWLMDRTTGEVQRYLDASPQCQVIILTYFDGDLSPFDRVRSFVSDHRVRVVPAGQGLIIPRGCVCYMLGPQASEADLAPVSDRVEERPDMRIPANPPWRFFCASTREEPLDPLAEWQNGLSLLRVVLEGALEPGGRLGVTYTWHYREVNPQMYHFFNHLLRGEMLVAQVDGPGIPAWYWRDGDVLVTRFELALPASLDPGEYQLRVGVYGWPSLERVLLADGNDGYEVGRWNIP
jgi:hypothetical protein